ncbi:hypothetical protein C2R22_05865 [Salinigranum rubrum]|uniref:Uncharacterized protein n=1 Tax=Salinigranum rubrum TaxID=755307 RepID=A0A2I8VH78_9EURY|nr:hypothetical protein [Salinigranum rubrum]AUV81244.1 hypothetical protein C2R22_05865 [Salinigranum rubrum]
MPTEWILVPVVGTGTGASEASPDDPRRAKFSDGSPLRFCGHIVTTSGPTADVWVGTVTGTQAELDALTAEAAVTTLASTDAFDQVRDLSDVSDSATLDSFLPP